MILDLDSLIPTSLAQSVREHGLPKLAAAQLGLPDMEERTVLTHIGTKLAERYLERKTISKGLEALRALQEER